MKKLLIVVGSKSDLGFLTDAKRLFRESKINFEVKVISCHRDIRGLVAELDPTVLRKNNVGVILAIAHSVANLPAIIAGYLKDSPVHVVGVGYPKTDIGSLESVLSVLSIPTGIPLLNGGIGKVGIHNASLACIKILK